MSWCFGGFSGAWTNLEELVGWGGGSLEGTGDITIAGSSLSVSTSSTRNSPFKFISFRSEFYYNSVKDFFRCPFRKQKNSKRTRAIEAISDIIRIVDQLICDFYWSPS